ncbi:hypothetical protein D3C75_1251550 [compost metagenome]
MIHSGLFKLFLGTITKSHSNRFDTTANSTDHIMLTISYHYRFLWMYVILIKHVLNNLLLLRTGTVQITSSDMFEIMIELIMLKNLCCKNSRFGGCYIQ